MVEGQWSRSSRALERGDDYHRYTDLWQRAGRVNGWEQGKSDLQVKIKVINAPSFINQCFTGKQFIPQTVRIKWMMKMSSCHLVICDVFSYIHRGSSGYDVNGSTVWAPSITSSFSLPAVTFPFIALSISLQRSSGCKLHLLQCIRSN